jgi:hypothetical protein
MSCGAPEIEAGTLMSHDGKGHCFFVRQPTTAEEVDAAILSLWSSCCGAVRYGSHDPEILVRLAEIGEGDTCDFRLENEPKQAHVSHLTFEFEDAQAPKSGLLTAREIMEYFAGFLTKRHIAGSRVLDSRFSGTTASFRNEWGHDSLESQCTHSVLMTSRVILPDRLLCIRVGNLVCAPPVFRPAQCELARFFGPAWN